MAEPYDASDPAAVGRMARLAKSADNDTKNILGDLMRSREGRLWVRGLLETCHVFHTSFSADPYKTAFAEGERNIGLRILTDVMASCPDLYIEMMKEKPE